MGDYEKVTVQLIVPAELAKELQDEFGEGAETKPYTGSLPESLAFGTGLAEAAMVLSIAANAVKLAEMAVKAAKIVQAWRRSRSRTRTAIIAVGPSGPEAIDVTEQTSEEELAETIKAAVRPE